VQRLSDRSIGIGLFLAGVVALLLCVPGLFQVASSPPLWVVLGWSAPVAVATLLFGGLALTYAAKLALQVRWWAVAAGELFMLALLSLAALYTFLRLPIEERLPSALLGQGGGLLGWAIFRLLIETGKPTLAWIIASAVLLLAGWLLWLTLPWEWTSAVARTAHKALAASASLFRNLRPDEDAEDTEDIDEPAPFPGEQHAGPWGARAPGSSAITSGSPAGAGQRSLADKTGARPAPTPAGAGLAARARSVSAAAGQEPDGRVAADAGKAAQSGDKVLRRKARRDTVPSYELLRPDDEGHAGGPDVLQRAQIIKGTLAEFGVPVEVVSVKEGPTVTQFGLQPGEVVRELSNGEVLRRRVSVATIQRLSNDLALALAATSIRIEAPVPGRPYVGVEVPNTAKTMVSLRSILEARDFTRASSVSRLAIALGRDVSGDPVVADLARMPHLLIAGATGSGKSVCINAIVTALLMNNGPDTVRFLMVDPKRVELPGYNGIPHLLGPVITEAAQATGALAWLALQMDERYRTFAAAGVRNILEYNRSVTAGKRGKAARKDVMPYIVLVIDELADLMMTAAYDVERQICRLAQMSRATGIHLILATQRPSVDVVTGLIKANFPARVAFAVTSQIDSRVILDIPGAEKLLGRGDMLLMVPESAKLARIQGCFVSDQEIDRVVEFWRNSRSEEERVEATRSVPPWNGILDRMDERDDLLEKALKVLRTKKTASTSLLQRTLRIGYPRAARLMEQLEEMGAVGPDEGGGRSREVLLQPEDSSRAPSNE
jgi:S-DNA-T family DNA segregation ATPase FtsK/SpoIIIE